MHDRSEDSAHPNAGPVTRHGVAYPHGAAALPSAFDLRLADHAAVTAAAADERLGHEHIKALDRVLYVAPFVLIDADNTGSQTVRDLADARRALASGQASTIAGTLRPGIIGADVDPKSADAILGDICAEALVAWCITHELPYIVRESGRPGGRHLIAIAREQRHIAQWATLCARLSRKHRVVVDNRTGKALRLLSAPHRMGWHAPVIGATMTTRDVLDANPLRAKPTKHTSPNRSRRPAAGNRDQSRSGREYGLACAMARLDYTADQAWSHESLIGGKSARKGELWWRRYLWMPAVTTVAAERDLNEDEAWRRAQAASPLGCRKLGRSGWIGLWRRALAEAATARPRRYRIDSAELDEADATRIDAVRRGLAAAAAAAPAIRKARPQRRNSVAALLHALAPAIVRRGGSISGRALAERSRLDTHTVRAALSLAVDAGVLIVAREYAGGANDCRAYAPGPEAERFIEMAESTETSPTSCSTPPPTGRCDPHLQHRRHTRDRTTWRLRCELLPLLSPGESFAHSSHPPAKALRSLWFQRRWWRSLSADEQAERRSQRRQLLREMEPVDTFAWFDWLAKRERIANAADRVAHGEGSTADEKLLSAVPHAMHRGMRDPCWRTGGTPGTEQPPLAAA